jgi:aminoglycoside 6'-N-acetyltransferase I
MVIKKDEVFASSFYLSLKNMYLCCIIYLRKDVFNVITKASINDCKTLSLLAIKLWTDNDILELENELCNLLKKDNAAFFIKYIKDTPIGFAQCSLRYDYVEGTDTSPVGYLEGVYILDEYRCNGFAKELVAACEAWAKEKGCTEFASDCEIINSDSLKFHLAIGFEETNRIICFKKKI